MTALGSRYVLPGGRSSGRRRTNRFTKLQEQFAARYIRMLESPAYRVLSLSAHRILDRIEIEFAAHGGTSNGKLPVTYRDFEEYGVDRHSIRPAINELCALGFIEITESGRAGNADWRKPNLFRLTHRHNSENEPATNEWERNCGLFVLVLDSPVAYVLVQKAWWASYCTAVNRSK
jgi:hypothetical protein